MAYFIGQSGYDGLNPINAIIVVGNSSRQWLQAIEIDKKSKTLGKIKTIIPRGPDDPDSIIDAIIVESAPPLRKTPRGTSEIILFSTESKSKSFNFFFELE